MGCLIQAVIEGPEERSTQGTAVGLPAGKSGEEPCSIWSVSANERAGGADVRYNDACPASGVGLWRDNRASHHSLGRNNRAHHLPEWIGCHPACSHTVRAPAILLFELQSAFCREYLRTSDRVGWRQRTVRGGDDSASCRGRLNTVEKKRQPLQWRLRQPLIQDAS